MNAQAARAVTVLTPSASTVSATAGSAITPVTFTSDATSALAFTVDVLPSGLAINASTGEITGTPNAAGTFTSIVTATEAGPTTATATISFTIAPGLVSSTSSLNGAVGSALASYTLTPSGLTPTGYALTGCTLPAGLAFDLATGLIAGTPEAPSSGTCTVTASDGTLSAAATLAVTIVGPTFSESAQVLQGVVGATLTSAAPGATNFFGAVGYAVAPALPPGFSLDAATGVISGSSLTVIAPTTFTITATDSATTPNALTANVQLIVDDATLAPAAQSVVGLVGAPIAKSAILVPTGLATGPVFTVAPTLPAGLSINPTTGVVFGTPGAALAKATFLVKATDSASKVATALIDITINAPLTAGQTLQGTVGTPLTTAVLTPAVVAPAVPAQGYSVLPALPAGLTLNVETGSIAGTPSEAIARTVFTITESDTAVPANELGATTLTLTIDGTLAPATQNLIGEVGTLFAGVKLYPAGMTNPVSMAIDPAIPGELSFNPTTGILSGTPVSAYPLTTYTVTATDANGATATAEINLTIAKVQLLRPVIGAVKGGATAGSLVVFFAKPFFTPLGHLFSVELYDASSNLVATKPTTTSPVPFSGLIPGATYTAIVVSPESATHSRVESLPVSGVATPGALIEPIAFSPLTVSSPMAGSAGWRDSRVQLASVSQAKAARLFVLKQRTARILASSPIVRIPKGTVARISVPWVGSKAAQEVRIKSGRVWLLLGSVKAKGGKLTTPAFRIVKPGTYPILIGSSGSVATFFKIIVSGGKA